MAGRWAFDWSSLFLFSLTRILVFNSTCLSIEHAIFWRISDFDFEALRYILYMNIHIYTFIDIHINTLSWCKSVRWEWFGWMRAEYIIMILSCFNPTAEWWRNLVEMNFNNTLACGVLSAILLQSNSNDQIEIFARKSNHDSSEFNIPKSFWFSPLSFSLLLYQNIRLSTPEISIFTAFHVVVNSSIHKMSISDNGDNGKKTTEKNVETTAAHHSA